MQQQKPARTYGITKVQYARMVAEWEASQAYQPSEGLFTRLKKRFG